MASHEHRRVANQQAHGARTREDWEALRRALLMLVAQYRSADPEGCYNLEVRVVSRDPTHSLAS
jgi:hypothetical protein